jgi:hypothetical protein
MDVAYLQGLSGHCGRGVQGRIQVNATQKKASAEEQRLRYRTAGYDRNPLN